MDVLFSINNFHQIYRRSITGVGVTGEIVRLRLKPISAKRLRVLTHVTVENRTNAYTKCRLAIDHGGLIFYLDELQTIAVDELAVSRSDILLGEADRLMAEMTGTTDGDELVMTCYGWDQKL